MTDEEKANAALEAITEPLGRIIEILKEMRDSMASINATLENVVAGRDKFTTRHWND